MQTHANKCSQNFTAHKRFPPASTLLTSTVLPAASPQQQWFAYTHFPFLYIPLKLLLPVLTSSIKPHLTLKYKIDNFYRKMADFN